MQATPLKRNPYFYPMKWMASMPSNAARSAGKVWLEAVRTAVFWSI